MRNFYFAFFTCSILVMSSCTEVETPVADEKLKKVEVYNGLEGSWRLLRTEEQQTADLADDEDPLLAEAEVNNDAVKGLTLSIFNDNTYTVMAGDGSYVPGTWTKENNKLTLRPDVDPTKILVQEVRYVRNELKLRNPKTGLTNIYSLEEKPLPQAKEDPLHKDNNTWRIAATAKESEAQVKERLLNIVKHYTYILKAANERKSEVVSFVYSRALINIYNGGIGSVPKDQLPEEWIQTFYSRNQALEAYNMFENYLESSTYRAASSGNWIEDDYRILLSIYAGLKGKK